MEACRALPAPDSLDEGALEDACRALKAASALACHIDPDGDTAPWAHAAETLAAGTGERPPNVHPTVWDRLGITADRGHVTLQRKWPSDWDWWALMNLPYSAQEENDEISLLWDGKTLHTTRPISFDGPSEIQTQVRAFGSDENSFDLRFRLGSELFIPAID